MSSEITYVGEDRKTVKAVEFAFARYPGEWLTVDDIVGDREDVHRFDVRLTLVEMLVTGALFKPGSIETSEGLVEVQAGDDGVTRWRAK